MATTPVNDDYRIRLAMYTAISQRRITYAIVGAYIFVIVISVFFLMPRLTADNQLTIAVLILNPISIGVGIIVAFWFQRSRDNPADGSVPVTATTTSPGGSTTTIASGTPVPTPPNPPASAARTTEEGVKK